MPALKLTIPSFYLPVPWHRARSVEARPSRPEPLPPVIVVEGLPDQSLVDVIAEVADRLGAAVSHVDDIQVLSQDPDRESVLAVILTRTRTPRLLPEIMAEIRRKIGDRPVVALTPRPVSSAGAASLPIHRALVAPPITPDALLYALDLNGPPS